MNFERLPPIRTLREQDLSKLCRGLRKRLLEIVPKTGGHLASNLGTVELTVAFHRVYDTSKDRLVFDVGHQCYCHKILTGRDKEMDNLRQLGGISGYPKPQESEHDAFIAGHASNSVSVALGMAKARTLAGEDYHVAALIGDGALTGGLAYAGESGEPLLVILNDNGMSITKNVGGVAEHLAKQRLKPQYLKFKQGYRKVTGALPGGKLLYQFTHKVKDAVREALLPCSTYLGPVDGHDVIGLSRIIAYAKELSCPVLLHVRTVKGKGYPLAERTPGAFHGVAPFDLATGKPAKDPSRSFSQVFGETMCRLAREEKRLCAVTAAMIDGTGLGSFAREFPERCFDVGIAEGHGAAMAAGMAKSGSIPVFAVYSSFLQRSYDGLLHDVGILGLPVIFAVDRAGLVGEDGETHHGLFDVSFLRTVPGLCLLAPASFEELSTMLEEAVRTCNGPVAIRYPRGGEVGYSDACKLEPTSVLRQGDEITLVTFGTLTGILLEVSDKLEAEGHRVEVIKLNQLSPLDHAPILRSVGQTGRLLVAEEGLASGGMGEAIAAAIAQAGIPMKRMKLCNVGNQFVPQGTMAELRTLCGLDAPSLYDAAKEVLGIG